MYPIVYSGNPYPLGATWDGNGINFALFADNATNVELCLFDNIDDEGPVFNAAQQITVESRSVVLKLRSSLLWPTS